MIPDDLRKISLLDWLENDLLLPVSRFEPASSDASFRRYFRLKLPDDRQFIAMDAPPERENVAAFVKVADLMANSQVRVPKVFHANLEDGFLVLEDFGNRSFMDALGAGDADVLYGNALKMLFNLQLNVNIETADLPIYDAAFFRRELGIFEEWFVNTALDMEIPAKLWEELCSVLIESALAQPRVCVHRDYHSRNLMLLDGNLPGVIDFQDAVIGPITYDVVSLLRDCYVAWPQERVQRWLEDYWRQLRDQGLIECDIVTFRRWFDLMGVQRHLKAIGIFSRLNLRDNKPGYLKDIPRTMNYVLAQTRAYPELEAFNAYLLANVPPQYLEGA